MPKGVGYKKKKRKAKSTAKAVADLHRKFAPSKSLEEIKKGTKKKKKKGFFARIAAKLRGSKKKTEKKKTRQSTLERELSKNLTPAQIKRLKGRNK